MKKQFQQKTNEAFMLSEHPAAVKWRKVLRKFQILGIVLFVSGLLTEQFLIQGLFLSVIIIGSLVLTAFSLIILILIFNSKFYNMFIYLLIMVIIGFYFKRMHWPGGGVILTFGFGTSALGFLFMSIYSLTRLKDNRFLRFFGFAINLILMLTFLGGLFKTQHWPGAEIFLIIGSILFFIGVLSMIFTLPNSNYMDWKATHKRFFHRAVIIPMCFIFISSVLTFVFPDAWNQLITSKKPHQNWQMQPIEYLDREGLN